MPRGRKKGNPFDNLPDDWKDRVAKLTYGDIDLELAKISKLAEVNLRAKEDDQDLQEKKEAAKLAGEQYGANAKAYRLMQQFCIRSQKDKGRPAGTFDPTDLDGDEAREAATDAAAGQ